MVPCSLAGSVGRSVGRLFQKESENKQNFIFTAVEAACTAPVAGRGPHRFGHAFREV